MSLSIRYRSRLRGIGRLFLCAFFFRVPSLFSLFSVSRAACSALLLIAKAEVNKHRHHELTAGPFSPHVSCCYRFCMCLLSLIICLARSPQECVEFSRILLPSVCCRFCVPLLALNTWPNRLITCLSLPLECAAAAADVLDIWLNSTPTTRRYFCWFLFRPSAP